jgi:hypothetical protein
MPSCALSVWFADHSENRGRNLKSSKEIDIKSAELLVSAPGSGKQAKSVYLPVAIWLPSEENFVVTLSASVGITVTRAKPMAAAMRPYSMAVAPDWSFKNFFMIYLSKLCEIAAFVYESALKQKLGENIVF